MIRRPGFFVIGAPKCGTTALCHYLEQHPQVCFSHGKEPSYFCTDLPALRLSTTEPEYLAKEFAHCGSHHSIAGEGSVLYLFSREAVPNINRFDADSRFLVMLRNPVDAVYSYHAQQVYNLDEDVADFETAWNLQEQRRQGARLPATCRDRQLLMYRDITRFGEQVQRLFEQVPRRRVHVILYEDFARDTETCYARVLEFLSLPRKFPASFPVINPNKRVRSRVLARIATRPPRWAQGLARQVQRLTGRHRLGVSQALASLVDRFNRVEAPRQPMPQALRARLVDEFRDDIGLLQDLLERDLNHWLDPE
ncbi:MAG: sulfotransferase [Gammaproteobacteria bacterium]|jgi:hypothetical protein|nr:sulfotransferase [Gammaproteobacteria bacterium]